MGNVGRRHPTASVDEDLSELERLEAAKKWWAENYKSIVAGALIAVVVVGGWRYWQHYQRQPSVAMSPAILASVCASLFLNGAPSIPSPSPSQGGPHA